MKVCATCLKDDSETKFDEYNTNICKACKKARNDKNKKIKKRSNPYDRRKEK